MKVKSESEVAQSCLTLSNPMDCSLPGSSIHGIFQARVLEWGAIAFSIKHTNICIIGVPEGEEGEKGPEKVFEEIIAENFSNMRKEIVNQVQCSYLENPRDSEAWWAAVYGVAQSWTRLKRLSSSSSSSVFNVVLEVS